MAFVSVYESGNEESEEEKNMFGNHLNMLE